MDSVIANVTSPDSLEQALKLIQQDPSKWQLVAGGTDLMVTIDQADQGKNYLNLSKLNELKGITVTAQFILIGALTTFSEIIAHPLIKDEFPLLYQAAKGVGAKGIQNCATIGGNLVNASPAADAPVALLCYPCKVEINSKEKNHWIPYQQFHLDYRQVALKPGELLGKIRLARTPEKNQHHYYRKVASRQALAISKLALAARIILDDHQVVSSAKIALGAVAPIPMRAKQCEQALTGKAITPAQIQLAVELMLGEISPIDDLRSSANYRHQVASNLLTHFLTTLLPTEN
ncbi:MAG: xanthine dehydrogenase family protein subunit M [Bdellovibrionales bacterium]|jgi:CO/xanthine dehydrogenase FAD-binding subunit|nr:xanthine dehydrogenase family protein subunit M [Bdellovibrionales bacterium]MBT3525736.1 xanthine dehydrogenase family protein subunit M [Bdellovibrionales bacterium]MBT7669663.1 xanthine dehydrogenase family protein subunit M [Bdellovibrionales bacterium]MBT7765801.1 xanthine dehydrogenase family protein subunit M [Bdellovibrionales bacterium]